MPTYDDELLLELLNTTSVEAGADIDLLGSDDDAAAWTRARGGSGTSTEAATVRAARNLLRDVALGDAQPEALTRFLQGATMVPAVEADGLQWRLDAPADDLVAVRAVLAWFDLEESRPGRIRACGNPDCRRFLIDRSPGNRAQWCSMAVCGNRMKARRHYQRKREAAQNAQSRRS